MIRSAFVKIFIVVGAFVSCSSLTSCGAKGEVSVTLEGQMGAFNEAKTISTLNLTAPSDTALKKIDGYKVPIPYFEEAQSFGYWSLDYEGKIVVNEDYIIKNDITLYAQYCGEIPDDTSYILFNASNSSSDPDRNTLCFLAVPYIKRLRYALEIDANVSEKQKAFGAVDIDRPTIKGDGYCCTFDYNGPVVIKIKGLYNEISFTKRVRDEKTESDMVAPITSGNNHILAFATCNYISKVNQMAMQNLVGLKAVHCSNYTYTIEDFAFSGCTNLEYISKMPYLTSISKNAFFNCYYLKHFFFPSTLKEIETSAFEGCMLLGNFNCPSNCEIGNRAFAHCYSLKDLAFAQGITRILPETFFECISLRRVSLPRSLKWIFGNAFAGCINLSEVVFENGSMTLEISESVFSGCTNLSKIIIPRQTVRIGSCTFAYTDLSELDLSRLNNVVPYESDLFKGTPLANKKGKIIVSRVLLNAYQSASGWSDYKDIIIAK